MTRTTFIRRLKIIGTTLAIALIVAFAIWRSLDYARGPHITITEPINGGTVMEKTVTIKGKVERSILLLLNGNKTNIDEQGHFSEEIIVFPGINRISLVAKDQFDRSTEERLTLVGNNNSASTTL